MGVIKLNNKIYGGHPLTASDITFNNSQSQLQTVTTQNAITFIDEMVDSNVSKISTLTTNTNKLKSKLFPVGSTYITSTNSNPSAYLGGTWELINKKFRTSAESSGNNAALITRNTTNVTSCTLAVVRGDNLIRFYFSFTNKVALADSTLNLGTINFNKCGITSFPYDAFIDGWSDGGNANAMLYIDQSTGLITHRDVVGTDSMATGKVTYTTITMPLPMSYMLDSFCDKFYWKRTA